MNIRIVLETQYCKSCTKLTKLFRPHLGTTPRMHHEILVTSHHHMHGRGRQEEKEKEERKGEGEEEEEDEEEGEE